MQGECGNGLECPASSIILVCRRREVTAPSVSRREFIRELNAVLPEALDEMTRGAEHSPVAPVDLSQAVIGPGMAVFSKYTAVLEADVLARAKGTSVEGVVQAGVVASGRGSVRLLRPSEYPADWSPEHDQRTPIWEAMHHLTWPAIEAASHRAGHAGTQTELEI